MKNFNACFNGFEISSTVELRRDFDVKCFQYCVTVKLSVSINESLPEIELAEAKFLSKEAFSIG